MIAPKSSLNRRQQDEFRRKLTKKGKPTHHLIRQNIIFSCDFFAFECCIIFILIIFAENNIILTYNDYETYN